MPRPRHTSASSAQRQVAVPITPWMDAQGCKENLARQACRKGQHLRLTTSKDVGPSGVPTFSSATACLLVRPTRDFLHRNSTARNDTHTLDNALGIHNFVFNLRSMPSYYLSHPQYTLPFLFSLMTTNPSSGTNCSASAPSYCTDVQC